MFRILLEFLMTIAVALIARAVFNSILGGISRASSTSFGNNPATGQRREEPSSGSPVGQLHRDPVCGTYVAESAALKRQTSGQTFYYCSESCREKHTLVSR